MQKDNPKICNECGVSVAFGSGNFVNRVPDFNDFETKQEMGKPFPEGEFLCESCANAEGKTPPRSFRYLGLLFTPWETLTTADLSWYKTKDSLVNRHDTPAGFNHGEFYEIAKKHGAGNFDVFLVKGEPRIAVNDLLLHYRKQ